ncbi:MAG: hypothetical protein ABIR79_21125 [Candidatus Binatia bacterium]
MTPDNDLPQRASWGTWLLRLVVALIVATPFIAIILQAIGKR